jgi:hypothetical protein
MEVDEVQAGNRLEAAAAAMGGGRLRAPTGQAGDLQAQKMVGADCRARAGGWR